MTISREEFFRLLPAAAGPFEVDGDRAECSRDGRRWTVRLTRLADRRVGSVSVPRHRVEIVFDGYSDPEAEAFMDRFRRAFLRGGG